MLKPKLSTSYLSDVPPKITLQLLSVGDSINRIVSYIVSDAFRMNVKKMPQLPLTVAV